MAELDISTKNCIVEKEGKTLIVTLNRPEAKNAFSPEMLLGMYKAWRLLDEDDDLKRVLGDRFVKAYSAVKREEFEAFNKVISSWEREYLLLNV